MAMLNVKMVNKQGQISIGKKYAGKKVRIDEYPNGTVVLEPVEIISEFEMKLFKNKTFQDRLKAFDRWESNNQPAETDLSALEEKLEDWPELSGFPKRSFQAPKEETLCLNQDLQDPVKNGFRSAQIFLGVKPGASKKNENPKRQSHLFNTYHPLFQGYPLNWGRLPAFHFSSSWSRFGLQEIEPLLITQIIGGRPPWKWSRTTVNVWPYLQTFTQSTKHPFYYFLLTLNSTVVS
jgi:hypothetical protein